MISLSGTLFSTLSQSTPLILAALGETIAERAGVVNVGLEGMMLTGAFVAAITSIQTGNALLGMIAGALSGVIAALGFAFFAVRLAANQVVVGVVINLFAMGLTGTLFRAIFGKTGGFVHTPSLPKFLEYLTPTTPIAFMLVPLVWWLLFRTRFGLELRACGEHPVAAEASGIPVVRHRVICLMICGLLAGFAGGFLSVGQVNTFAPMMTNGRGFIALAIVTSGRWNPIGCLAAALIFGVSEALQFQVQAQGHHISKDALLALPYIVTLTLLAFGGKWRRCASQQS